MRTAFQWGVSAVKASLVQIVRDVRDEERPFYLSGKSSVENHYSDRDRY